MTGSETVDRRGARTLRVSSAALAVAGLVVVSTAVRFAAARWFTTPWIAPDEMVYGLISLPLHNALTLRQSLLLFVLFSGFMLGCSIAKDRVVTWWEERRVRVDPFRRPAT